MFPSTNLNAPVTSHENTFTRCFSAREIRRDSLIDLVSILQMTKLQLVGCHGHIKFVTKWSSSMFLADYTWRRRIHFQKKGKGEWNCWNWGGLFNLLFGCEQLCLEIVFILPVLHVYLRPSTATSTLWYFTFLSSILALKCNKQNFAYPWEVFVNKTAICSFCTYNTVSHRMLHVLAIIWLKIALSHFRRTGNSQTTKNRN